MIKKKILSFATYPIANPQHGGQKRIDAIMSEYARAGIDARFVAIYHDMFYNEAGPYDIAVRGKAFKEVLDSPFTGDVICGAAIFEDPEVKRLVIKTIREFKPDVIDIHQAFPFLGLEPLLKELNLDIPLIFNSHNIEYSMKEEMLEGLGWSSEDIDTVVSNIRTCEESLAKKASITVAVSTGDAKQLMAVGAKNAIVAPNGINRIKEREGEISYWRDTLALDNIQKIALFVGSAHPPNWFGFKDMVGLGLGFLSQDERIVFAGSISEYVENEVSKIKLNPGATTFWKRAYPAGRLSQEKLEGLICFADTILLPITEGGGSNLKTAEAIISGKKIVATDYAFRGFEKLKELPNIYIANSQDEFVGTIQKVLSAKNIQRNEQEMKLAETVLWHNCLRDFMERVKES